MVKVKRKRGEQMSGIAVKMLPGYFNPYQSDQIQVLAPLLILCSSGGSR